MSPAQSFQALFSSAFHLYHLGLDVRSTRRPLCLNTSSEACRTFGRWRLTEKCSAWSRPEVLQSSPTSCPFSTSWLLTQREWLPLLRSPQWITSFLKPRAEATLINLHLVRYFVTTIRDIVNAYVDSLGHLRPLTWPFRGSPYTGFHAAVLVFVLTCISFSTPSRF